MKPLELSDIKLGTLVSHLEGEWASARRVIGIVIDIKRLSEKILVYDTDGKLIWHTADAWHLKHFWKVE